MSAMASQITSLTIVYLTVYSVTDQIEHQLCVTGLCEGNSPVTGEFPAKRASNAENVSIWWRHHVLWVPCVLIRYTLYQIVQLDSWHHWVRNLFCNNDFYENNILQNETVENHFKKNAMFTLCWSNFFPKKNIQKLKIWLSNPGLSCRMMFWSNASTKLKVSTFVWKDWLISTAKYFKFTTHRHGR